MKKSESNQWTFKRLNSHIKETKKICEKRQSVLFNNVYSYYYVFDEKDKDTNFSYDWEKDQKRKKKHCCVKNLVDLM